MIDSWRTPFGRSFGAPIRYPTPPRSDTTTRTTSSGDGITRGGYKLVYTDTIPEWIKKAQAGFGFADFSTSLGFSVGSPRFGGGGGGHEASGMLGNVWWNSPAFKAGITPDMEIVSVNGKAYSADVLREAILAAEKSKQPLELQFRRGEEYKTFSLAYYEGLRQPGLQRVEGTPDRLDEILAPSKRELPAN